MGLVLSAATAPLQALHRTRVRPPVPAGDLHPSQLQQLQPGNDDQGQLALAAASAGFLRYLWHSRYGDMLIEESGEDVFVNGQRVERHRG